MAFESELNLVTISIVIGIVGILSSILFQLRSIKRQHNIDRTQKLIDAEKLRKEVYETVEKTLMDKMESQTALNEVKYHILECNKKIEKLENSVYHIPRESNPDAWY